MTPPLPIDLDAEAIQLDGHWYTRDELARKIKGMLDAGDFAISKPSQALEQLTQHLATLRTIAFRVTPEMADAINSIGARHGRSVGGIIREALAMHLGLPPTQEMERNPPPKRSAPTGRRQTEPEVAIAAPVPPAPVAAPPAASAPPLAAPAAPAPAPVLTPPAPAELKAAAPPMPPAPPHVIAGPGALKTAQAAGHPVAPPAPAPGVPSVILDKAALSVEAAPLEAPPPPGLTPKKADEEGPERRWFGG